MLMTDFCRHLRGLLFALLCSAALQQAIDVHGGKTASEPFCRYRCRSVSDELVKHNRLFRKSRQRYDILAQRKWFDRYVNIIVPFPLLTRLGQQETFVNNFVYLLYSRNIGLAAHR